MVGTAVFCALEDGVLDEVGNAFLCPALVAGADVDVYAYVGDHGVVGAADDAEAVGEGMREVHCSVES